MSIKLTKEQFLTRLYFKKEALAYLGIPRTKFDMLCEIHNISPCKEIVRYTKSTKLYWQDDLDFIKSKLKPMDHTHSKIDPDSQKYGRLTVIREVEKKGLDRMVFCLCDCGKETVKPLNSLRRKQTQSCGCLLKEKVTNNIINQRFGLLVVIEKCEARKNNNVYWLCKCDCGVFKEIKGSSLSTGSTRSCGCQRGRKKKQM